MLEARDIHLRLGAREVLKGIGLRLESGQMTAILGPNGAGKTSLLRILSGEWASSAGEVRLDGRPLAAFSPRELGLRRAYLHQESSLDFAFTVEEVVMLGRSPHMESGERPEDYAVARQVLEAVDMLERAGDLYTRLSGGEKQRVQLARVLAQISHPSGGKDEAAADQTRLLFLDEPTNNLDLSHQSAVFRVARSVAAAGAAVCMVLHDLNQALRHADQIILLDKGRIALQGNAETAGDADACSRIFGVPLRRIAIDGSERPYLVEAESGDGLTGV